MRNVGEPGSTSATRICRVGYSASVRSVTESTRRTVYANYGVAWAARGGYEVDHLIPLELGGDNSTTKLWPELQDAGARAGYASKDGVENHLHALVCAGTVPLATAQNAIAANWYTAYQRYRGISATAPTQASPPTPPLIQVTPSRPRRTTRARRRYQPVVGRPRCATTAPTPTQPTTRAPAPATTAFGPSTNDPRNSDRRQRDQLAPRLHADSCPARHRSGRGSCSGQRAGHRLWRHRARGTGHPVGLAGGSEHHSNETMLFRVNSALWLCGSTMAGFSDSPTAGAMRFRPVRRTGTPRRRTARTQRA